MKTISEGSFWASKKKASQILYTALFIFSSIGAMNGQGIEIDSINALINAIQIQHSQANGVNIQSVNRDGFFVNSAGDDGLQIGIVNDDGVTISIAGDDGVRIGIAGDDGVSVSSADNRGFHVDEAGEEGLYIFSAGAAGIFIGITDGSGLYVEDSGSDGVHIVDAHDDGFEVLESGDDGLHVGYARGNGIRVGNADEYSMDIQGDKRGLASVQNHIARFYNFNNEGGGDVMALKVNGTDDPDHTSNFITFFKGGPDNSISNALGAIEGNGTGGITFKTNGADFAETLSQISPEEVIRPGNIVGVYQGQISLNTENADRVMVITDRPAIIGNNHPSKDKDHFKNVSFVGQVPVQVSGPVHSGDWIVASGLNDGVGIALSSNDLTVTSKILGQAWETNLDPELKSINTVIGLDQSDAKASIINQLQIQVKDQTQLQRNQQLEMEHLKSLIDKLSNKIDNHHSITIK